VEGRRRGQVAVGKNGPNNVRAREEINKKLKTKKTTREEYPIIYIKLY
jgi:hypothetical protein